MKTLKIAWSAVLLALGLAGHAGAELVASDLNDGGADSGFSDAWHSGSSNVFITTQTDLNYFNYGISQTGPTEKVMTSNAGPDRQDVRTLTAAMSGEIWFTVLVKVPAGGNYAGLTFNNFGNSYDPVTTAARVLMSASQLQVGFNGGAATTGTGSFSAGSTHLLLGQMNVAAGNDTLNVWVDPDLTGVSVPGDLPVANFTSTTVDFTDSITDIGAAGSKGSAAEVYSDAYRLSDTVTAFEDVTGVGWTPDTTPPALAVVDPLSPADDSTEVPVVSDLVLTFDEMIEFGTGFIRIRESSGGALVEEFNVESSSNLTRSGASITIDPTSFLTAATGYHVEIDATAIYDNFGNNFAGITDATTWNFTTVTGDPFLTALDELKEHVEGITTLTGPEIEIHKEILDAEADRFDESTTTIAAALDLVTAYDTAEGPLFVSGSTVESFWRPSASDEDIHWVVLAVMQGILDEIYNTATLADPAKRALLDGYLFGSSADFPGSVAPPATATTHTATISASFLETFGRDTQGWTLPARKPTGTFLAPGSIVTVTVPPALVGKGFQIRVGAHSWDHEAKNRAPVKRLSRATILYDIDATSIEVASPYGGGIYLEVPMGIDEGVVNIDITGAVRSPYFSAKSFHSTTNAEWIATERNHPAPWADFQSEKFMMQVPTSWIYALNDPEALMADWDGAMDAINDLMGFPRIRGKETMYIQTDVILRSSVHAPGYPATNVSYNPKGTYDGYVNNYFVRGPGASPTAAHIEFHEQGHAYFFPKFGGESESNVNLLQPAMLNRAFGYSLDVAQRASLGSGNVNRTLDNTAVAWMCVFNFSPREAPMATAEKAYQHKGHAKFMDVARLFGWEGLDDYWHSFMEDDANSISYGSGTDDLLLRLSRNVGKDIRPLFHFWGIHPQDPVALANAIAAESIPASPEIHNLLLNYKTLVPADNAAFQAFALAWWGKQPSMSGYWEEREHARQWDEEALYSAGDQQRSEASNPGEIYNANSASDIRNRIQELVDLYYPDVTAPTLVSTSPADNATDVSVVSDLTVTFDGNVAFGTGFIRIKESVGDGLVEEFNVESSSNLTLDGASVTIDPTGNLAAATGYYVEMEPTAIDDLAGNSFSGIINASTWNFTTTTDASAPVIDMIVNPSNGAIDVPITLSLVLTFDENVQVGTGNILIKRTSDDGVEEAIDVTSGKVTVVGDEVTIVLSSDLPALTALYVEIDAGAILDLVSNPFAGISGAGTWNFTTAAIPTDLVTADLNDGGVDTGFSGGWVGSSNLAIIAASDLTYANYGITQSGTTERIYRSNTGHNDRQDSRPLATVLSGNVWFSILVNVPSGGAFAGMSFHSSPPSQPYFHSEADLRVLLSDDQLIVDLDGGALPAGTGSFAAGSTHLLLGQMNVGGGNDTLKVWVDPNLTAVNDPGGLPAADFTETTIDFIDSIAIIGVPGSTGTASEVYMDAIRLSNTPTAFADVVGSSGGGGSDFSDWIAGYSVDGQAGIDDDPDGDGIDSGVENFFGTPPDAFSQGLVAGAVSGGAFTFTHPQGTLAADLTAAYRWSKDLTVFQADGSTDGAGTTVDFTTQADTPSPGITTVTATVSGVATDKLFVDVEVTQN